MDCSTKTFSTLRTIKTGLLELVEICYVPNPYKFIVSASIFGHTIQATSCDDGETAWKIDGAVQGRKIYPRGVMFLPSHGTLLVADRVRGRILALNPNNGCHLQTIDPCDVDLPMNRIMVDFCPYREHEFLLLSFDYPRPAYSHIREDVPMFVTLVKLKAPSVVSK